MTYVAHSPLPTCSKGWRLHGRGTHLEPHGQPLSLCEPLRWCWPSEHEGGRRQALRRRLQGRGRGEGGGDGQSVDCVKRMSKDAALYIPVIVVVTTGG